MKINLVNYEIGIKDGILSKYAREMERCLKDMGHKVSVSNKVDLKADINHHINYIGGKVPSKGKHTLMITHFGENEKDKIEMLKNNLKNSVGICFSQDTADWIKEKGLGKMEVVLPAHNLTRRPRLISIMTDLYPDGRKREEMFEELVKHIDKKKFVFSIIGQGWRGMLEELAKEGLQIQWQPEYNPQLGQAILSTTDYALYFGKDEGAISILDATNCGVRTIAPLVGFHKEIGIDFPFDTQEELNAIFDKIGHNPVEDLTWENYTKKHVDIWTKMLKK